MKNIKYFIFGCFIFCLCYAVPAFAEDLLNEIYPVNGGTIVSTEGASGAYVNSTAFPSGFLLSATSHDYRMETGLLSTFVNTNPKIEITNLTPSSSSLITVTLSVKVNTVPGTTIEQVGYRIGASTSGYIYLIDGYTAEYTGDTEVVVSTQVTLQPGVHKIYWFAKNNVDDDGNINMYTLAIGNTENIMEIKQPNGVSSSRPVIQATIISRSGISSASDVVIKIFEGSSVSGVMVSSKTANDSIFNINTGELNYEYEGAELKDSKQYTLQIIFDDGENAFDGKATFSVSSEAISYLLPYPSPYNPKNGDMTIKFIIAEQASVTINIYDRSGKIVSKVLDSETRTAGENKVSWNAKSYAGDRLANGIYICEIITKSGGKENRSYKSFAVLRK